MKKQSKRLLALILTLAMAMSLLCGSAWATSPTTSQTSETQNSESANMEENKSEVQESPKTMSDSGSCGDNLIWELDDSGILTISGTGAMTDYNCFIDLDVPWDDCSGEITAVVLTSGVTSIGDWAFHDCSSLTSISIPDSVSSIGEYAFNSCDSLTSVTIPDSVTSIGNKAFNWCDSLTSITIPASVASIGDWAFDCCDSLADVYITDLDAWCRISFATSGSNPLCSAENLYLNGALVEDLILPSSVTSVSNYAFFSYKSLTSVTIPDSVTTIGNAAFSGCENLSNVSIGDNLTDIGDSAFCNCSSLASISIPDSVSTIGYEAFACCNLSSISIPDSVTSIGEVAFAGCNITSAGPIGSDCGYEFGWTSNIPDNAFSGCYELTNVTIPNSVTSLGDCAFWDCSSLANISIPNSVTTIGASTFYGCSSLTSIFIPNSVTSIGWGAFSDCSSLVSISIPDSVTYIDWCAFCDCSSLASISIPDGVASIGDSMFYSCSNLASISIPDSVTYIGESAFGECYSLTDVYYAGSKSAWNAITIGSENEYLTNATIHFGSSDSAVKSIVACSISVKNCTYNGKAQKPAVTVKNGSTTLTKDTDYTVAYKNNTNVGTATVTITGKGNYTGTVTKTFKITQADQVITVKSYTKTLGDKAFSLGAKTNGGGKLTYKSSNTKVATISSAGKITVKGVGSAKITITAAATKNYKKASKSVTITVNPTGTKLSSVTNLSGKKMKVTWKKNSKVTGYQIQYSTSSKFSGAKTITVKSYKTTSNTISKLTKNKKYYVRIRTYKTVSSKNYYSSWSGSKNITIKK